MADTAYESVELGYGPPLSRRDHLAFAVEWRDIAQGQYAHFFLRTIRRGFLPKRPPRIIK